MKDYIVSPLSDFVFAKVFGDQKNIDNTRAFLKTLLDIPWDEYDELTVVSPILGKFFKQGKTSVVDLKLSTKSGKIIHIELQVEKRENLRSRILYYSARLIADQLRWGDDYEKLHQVISIVICDHNLLEEEDSYINEYELRNNKNHSFTDLLKVVILELPKLPEKEDGGLWRWLRFLKCRKKEEYDMLKLKYPDLEKPIFCAKKMSLLEKWRDIHFHKMLWKADEKALLRQAQIDGKEEGRVEGHAEEKLKIARNALAKGLSPEIVRDITGLSMDEIEKLRES
jgi:predicted transposase/invertase (TIGR01784 family)